MEWYGVFKEMLYLFMDIVDFCICGLKLEMIGYFSLFYLVILF